MRAWSWGSSTQKMHSMLLAFVPYVRPGLGAARSSYPRAHLLKCWWEPAASDLRQSDGPKPLLTQSWMSSTQSTETLRRLPLRCVLATDQSGCLTLSFLQSDGLRTRLES